MTGDQQPATTEPLTIGRLASLGGVTVRTLHHYDRIGLLRPELRTQSGYRAYTAADVARLQRILFYRELELPLDRIHQLIDDPAVDELDHLRRQHRELGERIQRLQRVRAAVQTTMEAHDMSIDLTPEERLEVFGGEDPSTYSAEASARWGDTEAYAAARQRTKRYTKDDWIRITAAAGAIDDAFVQALAEGAPPTSRVAMELAERARLHIDETYYPLSHEMHRNLADLHVEDRRFEERYERMAPGLAQYVHDAIDANADRHDGATPG
ncbi:MAG: MerR family transcriptional regulator [Solirubrobacteraceae bacterium]|nr:MerR family transcriptional regulator [Solirubrobacteraceae bacterium]